MPDADGNFLGIAVPAEAWERVFGRRTTTQIAASLKEPKDPRVNVQLLAGDVRMAPLEAEE